MCITLALYFDQFKNSLKITPTNLDRNCLRIKRLEDYLHMNTFKIISLWIIKDSVFKESVLIKFLTNFKRIRLKK
jgi:hypothetical protein